MPKKENGYLLPDVVNPETSISVCIPIPNDRNHRLAFLGQLDELGKWHNWERDDEHTASDVAQVWRAITRQVRAQIDAGEDCAMPPEFRNNNCQLQWRPSALDEWLDIPGASYLPLSADCDLNGGLKVRSDDAAKISLDVLHPGGNAYDVANIEAAGGGRFTFTADGLPIFINPQGKIILGTAAENWNLTAGNSVSLFSNQAGARGYIFGSDGAIRLGTGLVLRSLFAGVGEVQNAVFYHGLLNSTYATRAGFVRIAIQ